MAGYPSARKQLASGGCKFTRSSPQLQTTRHTSPFRVALLRCTLVVLARIWDIDTISQYLISFQVVVSAPACLVTVGLATKAEGTNVDRRPWAQGCGLRPRPANPWMAGYPSARKQLASGGCKFTRPPPRTAFTWHASPLCAAPSRCALVVLVWMVDLLTWSLGDWGPIPSWSWAFWWLRGETSGCIPASRKTSFGR
ncbi:hypothetical protein PENSPDRAFT_492325 [Peniophora sp. CONT]|nr:hypothetical protein PENSPDRAFT_492325 [Peniophora sp. CONT]